MLTVIQAAAILGLDPSQVRRHIRSGALMGRKIGARLWVIDKEELARFRMIERRPGPKGNGAM